MAIYKYGYTIIHGCDGDGFSHPVTDHDATRKKATAAEKKRMAGTIMESDKCYFTCIYFVVHQ